MFNVNIASYCTNHYYNYDKVVQIETLLNATIDNVKQHLFLKKRFNSENQHRNSNVSKMLIGFLQLFGLLDNNHWYLLYVVCNREVENQLSFATLLLFDYWM